MANLNFFTVTPSDAVPLQQPVWLLYVGVAGNVSVKGVGDATATVFTALPVGWARFPQQVAQVMATGTTATGIVGGVGSGSL